jgi:hypothetical protein
MNIYISNAFSLQMFAAGEARAKKIPLEEAKSLLGKKLVNSGWSAGKDIRRNFPTMWELPAISAIGHADVAEVLNNLLGLGGELRYKMNRISVALEPGDILVVGQYVGPRLPEGTTTLPEGAKIEWYLVCVAAETQCRREECNKLIADQLYNSAAAEVDGQSGSLINLVENLYPQLFQNIGD